MYREPPMGECRRALFVADRVQPRLGMTKALESLLELLPPDQVELVLISGPPPAEVSYQVSTLNKPTGWRGRLLAMRELRRICKTRAESGAVVVSAGSWVFVALALATVFSRYKLTLWEHSILPWRIRHEWRVAVLALALRLLAFRLERVVCVSESNRSTVARIVWPFRQLAVIPNVTEICARDDLKIISRPESDTTHLLGIGSLTHGKNWELAIRAMKHLPSSFKLKIAGEGRKRQLLTTLISELGLEDRVDLLGYVPQAERLMDDADIVVHPSFAETFGYVMAEASRRGRPVVVLNMPAMNEMVPGLAPGELADSTPSEFAQAVLRAKTQKKQILNPTSSRYREFDRSAIKGSWNELIHCRQG